MIATRSVITTAIPIVALLAYLAFALYGLYLDDKLGRLRGPGEKIPKDDRWNPGRYPAGCEKWIARDRTWHRLQIPVWLGLIVIASVVLLIVRPR